MRRGMESSSLDASSDLEERGLETPSSPARGGQEAGTPQDAASRPLVEENSFPGLPGQSGVPRGSSSSREDRGAQGSPASARSFLEKLWAIVSSRRFQSIWWGDNGNCIVIAERFFCREVLGRKRSLKIFESETMEDFILQLNLHGFRRMEGASAISISIHELQALVAAGASLGRLHFFSSPGFQREQLQLFPRCQPSPEEAAGSPAAAPRSPGLKEQRPRKRRAEAPAVAEAEEMDIDSQCHAALSLKMTEPRADPAAPSTSAAPAPAKRPRSRSPSHGEEVALAPSPPATQPRSPAPAPAALPPQHPAWGPSWAPWNGRSRSPDVILNLALPPAAAPPAPGAPPQPAVPSGSGDGRLPGPGALPPPAPQLQLPARPPPRAAPMPRPVRGRIFRHCPTCHCPPTNPPAGQGDGR